MLYEVLKQLKTALLLLIIFTLLTGLIYPGLVTAVAQLFFPWKANGSLIFSGNKLVGSKLIGQSFTEANYFWGRPSATTPFAYNALNSSGSNLGPSNPNLAAAVKSRIDTLRKVDPDNHKPIPVELVTASGSGLDPEISPLAAYYQVSRVAKARGIPEPTIQALVTNSIVTSAFGILGEPRVNVLSLNLALDHLTLHKELR